MGSQMSEATGDAGLNGCMSRRLAWLGGQSWLQAGFPAGWDALKARPRARLPAPHCRNAYSFQLIERQSGHRVAGTGLEPRLP